MCVCAHGITSEIINKADIGPPLILAELTCSGHIIFI